MLTAGLTSLLKTTTIIGRKGDLEEEDDAEAYAV